MRSKVLWATDLGLVGIGSGELSPELDPINLRFYPSYGFGDNEWEFEVGVKLGENPIYSFSRKSFSYDGNYFNLLIQFKELFKTSNICIMATHYATGNKEVIWEGDILPNQFLIESKIVGLTLQAWDVCEGIKNIHPKINPKHFAIPTINVKVKNTSILVAHAGSLKEHDEKNVPITLLGFHPKQIFDLDVYGHVLGYGGCGGNAGISTVTNEIDIIYPTDGLDGGNLVYVEYDTQQLNIHVHCQASFIPGYGGGGATAFFINCPERRINQIGHAGRGGYPNGLNGKITDVQYRLKLLSVNVNPNINIVGKCDYTFTPANIVGHSLPINIPLNVSVPSTKEGKRGLIASRGIIKLINEGNSSRISNLTYTCNGYIFS